MFNKKIKKELEEVKKYIKRLEERVTNLENINKPKQYFNQRSD